MAVCRLLDNLLLTQQILSYSPGPPSALLPLIDPFSPLLYRDATTPRVRHGPGAIDPCEFVESVGKPVRRNTIDGILKVVV